MENNKQTAMQMAIDHYKTLSEQGSNQAYIVAKFLEENYLEIEKKQIIDAVKHGNSFEQGDLRCELYFKKTFKLE